MTTIQCKHEHLNPAERISHLVEMIERELNGFRDPFAICTPVELKNVQATFEPFADDVAQLVRRWR